MYVCIEGNEVLVVIVWIKEGRKLEFLYLFGIVYFLLKCYLMLNEEEFLELIFFDFLIVSMIIDSMGLYF